MTQLSQVEKRSKSGSRIGSKACKQAGSYALKRRTIPTTTSTSKVTSTSNAC